MSRCLLWLQNRNWLHFWRHMYFVFNDWSRIWSFICHIELQLNLLVRNFLVQMISLSFHWGNNHGWYLSSFIVIPKHRSYNIILLQICFAPFSIRIHCIWIRTSGLQIYQTCITISLKCNGWTRCSIGRARQEVKKSSSYGRRRVLLD